MNDHVSHDWLSAYADGELSGDERARTERRLEGDSAARRELAEIHELGELLRSLPTHELPAGFPAMVLQRCERESLFAEDAADSHQVAAARSNAVPKRARSSMAIVVSVVATAAMLFLLVQVASPPGTPVHENRTAAESLTKNRSNRSDADKERSIAANSKRERGFKHRKPASDATLPAAPFGVTSKLTAKYRLNRSAPVAASATRPVNKSNVAGGPTAGGRPAAGAFPDPKGGGAGLGGGYGPKFDLGHRQSGFRIGEVIPYLQVNGDRTAVIEVTVIDVNLAVGRLEVLLERKLVMPVARTSKHQNLAKKAAEERKQLTMKEAPDGKSKSELIAVYVESTQAQLAQVIQELNRETQSLHISLRPPVALGDVRLKTNGDAWTALFRRDLRRSPRTLADAAAFGRQTVTTQPGQYPLGNGSGSKGGTAKSGRPTGGIAKDGFQKANRNGKLGKSSSTVRSATVADQKQAAAAPAGGKKSGNADAAVPHSFQLRLNLAEEFASNRDKRDYKKLPLEKSRRRTAAGQSRGRNAGVGIGSSTPRPVQVIFVFRLKSPPRRPVPARRP